jgi:membrane protein DedA with SNARE-associated domain
MVPLMRSLISIPAGMSGMNFSIFLIYTLVGTLIWNTVLVVAGSILGESWGKIVEFMDVYSNITYVILGLAGIAVVALWIVKKKPFRKES